MSKKFKAKMEAATAAREKRKEEFTKRQEVATKKAKKAVAKAKALELHIKNVEQMREEEAKEKKE